ncbi:site-specific integrase, partial [Staphylococcus aureus]|nr:site-specific integrase [Staphylococcus aureus]
NILVQNMNAKVIQDLINSSLKDGLSHKVVKDDLSIIKNILRYTQKKYNITDISYIDDVIVPKKATTREEIKAKRENYLEMNEILAIAEELKRIANKKRASY